MLRCSVILALVALLGCSNPPHYLSPVYDACWVVDDCVETATLCEDLSIDFGGVIHTNGICTLTCETEGALSPDCPRALVGRFGSCYPSSVAGGVDNTPHLLRTMQLRWELPRGVRLPWRHRSLRERPYLPYRRKRRDLRTWPLVTLLRLPAQTRATPLE